MSDSLRPHALQVWSAALTSPVSWSIPLHCTTSGTRAGPGAMFLLRRPLRWTCWMGLRRSIPRKCPEVRVEDTTKCPEWSRMRMGCLFLFEILWLLHPCSVLFPLKPVFNICAFPCLGVYKGEDATSSVSRSIQPFGLKGLEIGFHSSLSCRFPNVRCWKNVNLFVYLEWCHL